SLHWAPCRWHGAFVSCCMGSPDTSNEKGQQNMKSIRKTLAFTALAATLCFSAAAQARDLVIALRSEPTSMDPQFHSLTPNTQLSETIFDPLVRTDKVAKPIPSLAESWTVDGDTWTFNLRKDDKFSDGTPFTAEDVVFRSEERRVGKEWRYRWSTETRETKHKKPHKCS